MEREKLKALLERSGESGFTPQSGVQLLEWLEKFAANVKNRVQEVRAEVDKLVDQTNSVEQELHNTFNSFRLLSNSQFIENRVYEEDETVVHSQSGVEQQRHLESYEDDIVPRYREAVALAWNAHEEVLKSSSFRETKHKRLPYIIGTDEFMRDPGCGLSDTQRVPSSSQLRNYDSEAEKDGASMAAQMVGVGAISENEWSEPDTSSSGDQDNKEPAVSAALDFKAMLEAALRGLPYEDSVKHEEASDMMDSRNGFGDASVKDEAGETPVDVVETQKEAAVESSDKDEVTNLRDILGKIAREAGNGSRRSFDGSSSWSGASDDENSEAEEPEVQVIVKSSSSPKLTERIINSSEDVAEEVHQPFVEDKETTSNHAVAAEEYRQDKASTSDASVEEFSHSGSGKASSLRPKSLFEDEKIIPASSSSSSFSQQGALRNTTLSSLLFGDEDEDEDEAALFGPVKRSS